MKLCLLCKTMVPTGEFVEHFKECRRKHLEAEQIKQRGIEGASGRRKKKGGCGCSKKRRGKNNS